ncbi:hypothetical protein EAH83_01770 [Variovorax ginsengisoli]|uniref:Uncharacterized protein n=1 Tax=Variovorax guangxiensis TaxID=1775474 RepID=A0A502E1G9_9BURK|nr:hypothetical protein EAH83_01770 [Variovorax ginsengisoli]TPG30250.1 hypothetical protein EAH82_01770 [Variovorax guangxiensis]
MTGVTTDVRMDPGPGSIWLMADHDFQDMTSVPRCRYGVDEGSSLAQMVRLVQKALKVAPI